MSAILTKLLTIVVDVAVSVLISKIQLWWAKRQAEYYKRKAEIEAKRLESLKEGNAAEEAISKSGDTAILHAEKAKTWEDRVEELRRRAEERANKYNKDEVA